MPTRIDHSLLSMVRTAQRRVHRATDLIADTEDGDVVTREMRYITPFWEFYRARQKLSNAEFWRGVRKQALSDISEKPFHRTALVWMPRRSVLCAAVPGCSEPARKRLVSLLLGTDLVMYNFMRLVSRMHHSFTVPDPETFDIETQEDEGGSYVLQRRSVKHQSANGSRHNLISCRFRHPNGEELKIEKDMSGSMTDPHISIVFSSRDSDEPTLTFEGTQRDLKSGAGGALRVR